MSRLTPAASQARIGPIHLAPGIPVREVLIFLLVTGIAVVLSSFQSLMQPYVFKEMLHIPANRQGLLSGQLMTVQQIVVLLCVGFAGALADKFGRKVMLAIALVGYSLCAALYPFASTIAGLFLIRILFGLVSTGHTAGGPTKFFDYPDNGSRGKFMALVMVFYAVLNVIFIGGLGSHLPGWLRSSGMSVAAAGARALWFAAAVGLITAVITRVFMMRDKPAPKPVGIAAPPKQSMRAGFREVIAYSKVNKGFGMLLVTSFVIRTDTAVISSFMALWVTTAGAHQGVSTIQAVKIAGTLASIISAMSFVAPPILGFVLDRFSRQTVYVCAVGAVGLAFACAPLVHSVTGPAIYGLAFAIGLAESAQIISQQAFFGQEAPAHLRGTAYGLLALFGTLSVIVTSLIAGYVFDTMGPTAPFVVAGALHLGTALVAVAILFHRATTRGAPAIA
jgi:MFS family permease